MSTFIADFRGKKIKDRKCEDERCNCDSEEAYCIIETEFEKYAVCEAQFETICKNTNSKVIELY